MAQKVQILLEDDLDGTEAAETVTFGLDGTTYEIDLNDENATALRDAMSGYIGHARKVGAGGRRTKKAAASNASGPSAADIREWARANGHEVTDRGRVNAELREAYLAAN